MDLEKDLLQAIQGNLANAFTKTLNDSYNNPLRKMVEKVVAENESSLLDTMRSAFSQVIKTDAFKEQVIEQFQHKVAKLLVSNLEGSVQKAADKLKQDPTIRARMIIAIEEIVKNS